MTEASRLVAECKSYINDLANWREDDSESLHEAAWQSALMTIDALAALIPPNTLAHTPPTGVSATIPPQEAE